MKYITSFLLILFLLISINTSWAYPNNDNDPVTFPYLLSVEKNGRTSYINYMITREFHELTNKFYTGALGKRRWIGPDDIFLEYEILNEDPPAYDSIPPLKNTYRCLVWLINGSEIALKVFYDNYSRGEKEWEGKTDTDWRYLGPVEKSPNFSELLEISRKIYTPPVEKKKLSFPILFNENEKGQQTYLYDLKAIRYQDIYNDTHIKGDLKTRKIMEADLFLVYEMMEDMSVYTDEGIKPAGNLYRCLVCFTDNGGWNSEIYIRLLSDTWWKDGEQWEEPIDLGWRYVGYLDEIPNFQHLLNAYRKYKSILE